ncbi:protealysin inhibitor emfourin [Lentzea kentuckyensis]|uniref:protealysin inhibitor emfourin n=1 Tax=Lentzea kentuckyensis TaxID=360086 RepID=UPI000A3ABB27|nr:protealysin inhibitor emfourin [Lentzea kentuckyensis]
MTVVRGGGLAGLVSSTAVDTSTLALADARALRARVRAASLTCADADAGADAGAGAPQPDREIVEIIVEDDEGTVTALVNADHLSPDIRELIEWVESAPGRTEQLGPPGTGPA